MKLIQHSSLWGNLYRHRYYKDGKRISEAEYDRLLKERTDDLNRTLEKSGSVYRIVHRTKEGTVK